MITELTLPILKLRSTGDAVKVLQRKLIQHGYFIGFVDGIFGLLTRRAVVKFQRKNGLLADAIVGPITWSKLNSK
jgi:g-D-glutamyl-meso-diaminopimelate peptidase